MGVYVYISLCLHRPREPAGTWNAQLWGCAELVSVPEPIHRSASFRSLDLVGVRSASIFNRSDLVACNRNAFFERRTLVLRLRLGSPPPTRLVESPLLLSVKARTRRSEALCLLPCHTLPFALARLHLCVLIWLQEGQTFQVYWPNLNHIEYSIWPDTAVSVEYCRCQICCRSFRLGRNSSGSLKPLYYPVQ